MKNILAKPYKLGFIFVFLMFLSGVLRAQSELPTLSLKYPVVLVHGLMGFGSVKGLEYFVGIPQALAKDNVRVFAVDVSGVHSSELRGEQLLEQVEKILALTGATKVHLFGHSQGALSARYVASIAPERVASVTSIAGVNYGSQIADIIRGVVGDEGTRSEWLADRAFGLFYRLLTLFIGDAEQLELKQSPKEALASLTTPGVADFNARYPQGIGQGYCTQGKVKVNETYYFSWGGVTQLKRSPRVADYFLGLLSMFFKEKNDGLVARCSNHLGHVIADNLNLHHYDLINIHNGTYGGSRPDPVSIYRDHVQRLAALGL